MTLFFFFRRRIIINPDRIPTTGPAIIVANHPVTFLDPLLVAISTRRPVHFLAKGALFSNPIVRRVFKTFNMIPIYRAQDDPSDMSKNMDTFQYCYEHLEAGGLMLIFPEGVSFTDRTLKPIKTGAARIALGCEVRNDFRTSVKIIPVGLTYEAPHKFRKDVLIEVGEPISMIDYKSKYIRDERHTVHEVTNQIEGKLKDLTLHCDNSIEQAIADFLLTENANKELNFEKSVKAIKLQLSRIKSQENSKVKELIYELSNKQKVIGVQNLSVGQNLNIVKETIFFLFSFLIGVPLMLFGLFHNWLPYFFSPIIGRKITRVYEYQGPIAMTTGMILCLLTYPIFGWIFFMLTGSWILTILYVTSLPLIGLVAYGFSLQYQFIMAQWKMVRLFQRERELVSELIIMRKEILGALVMT